MNVELKLSGRAVQTLGELGHIPGWPLQASPDLVKPGSPDEDLDRACARFIASGQRRNVGRGFAYVSSVSQDDAELILTYLDKKSGALLAPGCDSAEARSEGREIRRALDQAVLHFERRGVNAIRSGRTFLVGR